MAQPRTLPFEHPDRRTARIDDLPAILAEVSRLYEVMRVDVECERHAYAQSLTKHLKIIADLMQVTDLENRMRDLERRLGKTPAAPARYDHGQWSGHNA